MPIQIRRAEPADAESLVPLIASYWHYDGISGFDEDRGLDFGEKSGYRLWIKGL